MLAVYRCTQTERREVGKDNYCVCLSTAGMLAVDRRTQASRPGVCEGTTVDKYVCGYRQAMASRGRRGVPARGDEQRREERVEPRHEDQGEQQASAPQGPVLPPPPPMDYGVFMQGLVQAMQTQGHTQAALQAQLEAQAQVLVPQAHDHGGPSIMEKFKRMAQPSFKGESDPLLAESWMREIEKIFRAIRCAEDDKVTLATYMLQERADVWWSSLLRTRCCRGGLGRVCEALSGQIRSERIRDKME
ncbi:hypothetical protein Taro_003280, partial [Colocasia esculenta]|nr:hypothetical protein [Colocasia esculenta]